MQDVTLKKQVAGDFWLKLVVPLCGRRLTSEKSLLIVFVSCIVCFVGFSDCLVHVKHFFCVSALLLPHCAFEHMFSQCVTGFRLLPNTAVECLCVCAGGVNADTRTCWSCSLFTWGWGTESAELSDRCWDRCWNGLLCSLPQSQPGWDAPGEERATSRECSRVPCLPSPQPAPCLGTLLLSSSNPTEKWPGKWFDMQILFRIWVVASSVVYWGNVLSFLCLV